MNAGEKSQLPTPRARAFARFVHPARPTPWEHASSVSMLSVWLCWLSPPAGGMERRQQAGSTRRSCCCSWWLSAVSRSSHAHARMALELIHGIAVAGRLRAAGPPFRQISACFTDPVRRPLVRDEMSLYSNLKMSACFRPRDLHTNADPGVLSWLRLSSHTSKHLYLYDSRTTAVWWCATVVHVNLVPCIVHSFVLSLSLLLRLASPPFETPAMR